MKRRTHAILITGLLIASWFTFGSLSTIASSTVTNNGAADKQKMAPEFTHLDAAAWINSPPLSLQKLRGNVVLVDFWTFACWNCYRSFPWLNGLEAKYKDQNLKIIGIHTPEFEREKIKANVVDKIKEFGLQHPVMMDNDFRYWNAMNNRYWPAFYLIDKHGRIRASYYGETHNGDRRARAIEQDIERLLAEQY